MNGSKKPPPPKTWIGLLGTIVLVVAASLNHESIMHLLEGCARGLRPIVSAISETIRHHGILSLLIVALVAVLAFFGFWLWLHYRHLERSIK